MGYADPAPGGGNERAPDRSLEALAWATLRPVLPLLVVLAYAAFLLTGFGAALGKLQPIPVYLFGCLLLLVLQIAFSRDRSIWYLLYVVLSSGFAVFYAGEFVFGPIEVNVVHVDLVRAPITYVLTNAILFALFLLDAIVWDRARRSMLGGTSELNGTRGNETSRRDGLGSPGLSTSRLLGRVPADFAGLAMFFLGFALLLDLLGDQVILQRFGGRLSPSIVVVDLNQLFYWALPSPINRLEGLNLLLGLAATAGTLMSLVLAGVQLSAEGGSDSNGGDVAPPRFVELLRATARNAGRSLRLVLGPLVWLVPAASVALFAQQVARYFTLSALASSGTIGDLFNPLSTTARANWAMGVETLLLGLLAVGAMLLAVLILDREPGAGRRILRAFAAAGRATSLTLALFLYSLAVINAVVVLLGITRTEPFQVGAPGLIALLLGIALLATGARHATRQAGIPAAATTALTPTAFAREATRPDRSSTYATPQPQQPDAGVAAPRDLGSGVAPARMKHVRVRRQVVVDGRVVGEQIAEDLVPIEMDATAVGAALAARLEEPTSEELAALLGLPPGTPVEVRDRRKGAADLR